jgi:Peptidase M50B-like
MIRIDSDELKAWHEVGHATVCLHLGGDLDRIEFLMEDTQGFAVTRGCYVMPDKERSVACGGFAAEFYLLRNGYLDGVNLNDPTQVAEVSARIFSNAWRDHQEFIGRLVTEDNDFTREEKVAFMNYAINSVSPIISIYFSRMQLVVRELLEARTIEGTRVRDLLQIGFPKLAH